MPVFQPCWRGVECVCASCSEGQRWFGTACGDGVEVGLCWWGLGIGCGDPTDIIRQYCYNMYNIYPNLRNISELDILLKVNLCYCVVLKWSGWLSENKLYSEESKRFERDVCCKLRGCHWIIFLLLYRKVASIQQIQFQSFIVKYQSWAICSSERYNTSMNYYSSKYRVKTLIPLQCCHFSTSHNK